MQPTEITSIQNPAVKQVVRLRDRKEREKSGLFIIEGYRELVRAIDAGVELVSFFFCPFYFLGSNERALIAKVLVKTYECSEKVFQKISYRDRPDGLIAIARQKYLGLQDLKKHLQGKQNPFLVVCEAIEKPGNLGTILRSSDGVAVDGLIVCDSCTDIYNPNTVRASVGTLFTVPVFIATSCETIEWLKKARITILAATPSGEKEYTKVDLNGPVCIAVGTEQIGLSKIWMENADMQVRIPMKGVADSLNVAQATTLLLYETLRQRG